MNSCFECAATGPGENHHVVPKSRGGIRTVWLCQNCHNKAHHRKKNMSTSALTKAAMVAKRERNEYLGGYVPYGYSVDGDGKQLIINKEEQLVIEKIKQLRAEKLSLRKIGGRLKELGIKTRGDNFNWQPKLISSIVNR